jgi:hypothetical protein
MLLVNQGGGNLNQGTKIRIECTPWGL